jgi:hypothetical protein
MHSAAPPPWATARRTAWAIVALAVCLAALTLADVWLERVTGIVVGTPFAHDAGKPDLRFGYTPADVAALLDRYGPDGRRAYAVGLVIDTVYPVALGAATILLAARAWAGRARWTWAAPLTFAVLDVVENALFGIALASHPVLPSGLLVVASAVTRVKLVAFPPTVAVAVVAAVVLIVRRRRGGDRPT